VTRPECLLSFYFAARREGVIENGGGDVEVSGVACDTLSQYRERFSTFGFAWDRMGS
jgi:hypothetical protein